MANSIHWQGFHHIALVTKDLDATIRFYGTVLGMSVGKILVRSERHCFIKPGSDTWGLHFFEHKNAAIYTHPDLLSDRYVFLSGALQHVAFSLPDEATANTLRQRLREYEIEMTDINQIDKVRNFLFLDNNGILLEATWTFIN